MFLLGEEETRYILDHSDAKAVMLSHNNLYQNARATWKANEAAKGDITLICLPLAHSFGVVVMNSGNLSGSENF
jgi:long-subunit acyl-CoA synthetase (AMP-forming)